MTLIGYARVSTNRQGESLAAQVETLTAAGCVKVFTDETSGARASRPGLDAAREYLRDGETLMVTRLDRLGRTFTDSLLTLAALSEAGVRVRSIRPELDTGDAAGRFMVHVLLTLAEMEREMLIERTNDGLAHARKRGRVGGRPPALTGQQADAALAALRGGMSLADVARVHGVSRWTVARLRDAEEHESHRE